MSPTPSTSRPTPPPGAPPLPPLPGLLDGHVVLVNGAGRGIGAATAGLLAASGARVGVVDVDAERAEQVAGDIDAAGGQALALTAELRDRDAVDATVARTVDAFGRLDAVVNVAGGMHAYAPWGQVHEWTDDRWDEIVDRNLRWVFLACRAALSVLLEQGEGGAIVNVTSISGTTSAPRHGAYGAAKAGLVNLTRTLAVEYGEHGIRANAVGPGSVLSPATADVLTPQMQARTRHTIPMARRGAPDEIARAVLFLVSPLASYVTGQTLMVDGGASVRFPLTGPSPAADETPGRAGDEERS